MMKVLVLMFFCYAAAARSGHSLNYDHSWTPNVENVYKYTSPELIQAVRKPAQPSTSIVRHPLILTAEVKVQAFADQSLRLKLDHIRFYSNNSPISLKNAHQTLEDEISNPEGMSHNAQTFKTYLKTPILVHLKRGVVKKVIVSQNEPAEVTEIKKQLVSDLEKSGSQARIQLLMKKAIIKPLETPRFPMRVDLDYVDGIGGGYATRVGIEKNGESMKGMEEGFESGSRNITQENEGGHGPRLEPAYAFTCPDRCTTCKTGGSSDGGLPINSNGFCEHFCSNAGYCGIGDKYKENNDGVDCSSCKSSDPANFNYDIVLGGETRLEGQWVNANASLAFPMGENIFIVACVGCGGNYLKMVKIRVTGKTTFDWIEAKVQEGNYPTYCKSQETFTVDCFVGTSVDESKYSVVLVAKPQDMVCKTFGGPSWNSYCAFPFTYENVTYNECAYDELEGFWCPTANNVNLRNNTGWGKCDSKCPLTDPNVKKIQTGTLCNDVGLFEITSKLKCSQAASKLGLKWAHSFNGPNDFPGCFYAEDGRNNVYYNLNPNPGRTNLSPKYAAICKVPSVVNHTYDGKFCSGVGLSDINSAVNCKAAAMKLHHDGLFIFKTVNDPYQFPRCSSNWRFPHLVVVYNSNANPRPRRYYNTILNTAICEDDINIESECPRNKDLPVLKEGFASGKEDQFYCAFTWNKWGDTEPMRGCNGQKRIWMDREDYNVGTFTRSMVSVGSVMVKAGCTLYGYSDYDRGGNVVKYSGPSTWPNACGKYCPNVDPVNPVPHAPRGRFAKGFRSVQCRCKQDPIVCQPYDEWVLITQYDNKLDVESKFEYTKEIGTTWSKEASESFEIGASVEASMSASFFGMVSAELSVSASTGYNWGKVSTQAKSTKQTFKITVTVPPRTLLLISAVEANCGSNNIKTELFKAEGYDPEGNSKYTTYDDTIPSKSEQILNFK